MMGPPAAHGDGAIAGPSDRSFGLTFAVVFVLVGLLPLWRGGAPLAWALIVAAAFLTFAAAWPRALAPVNRVWLRLGLVLHRVVNPVVMAVLFYGVVTPFGFVTRLFGGGLAPRLRSDAAAKTYWIARDEHPSRMDQQF